MYFADLVDGGFGPFIETTKGAPDFVCVATPNIDAKQVQDIIVISGEVHSNDLFIFIVY